MGLDTSRSGMVCSESAVDIDTSQPGAVVYETFESVLTDVLEEALEETCVPIR